MELTRKQEEGLKIAVERYKHRELYTVISGFAGSGKSTLIKFIISALNLSDDDVAYVAYTGKAANVLKQKGCLNPTTAHQLLYYSRQLPDGSFYFVPKKSLDWPYKLIVVDEVSMLPREMWELLLSHKVYILACGDPGQLPPISKDQDNHVLDTPHIFLDEIMRQAQDSGIIRLSMLVREGKDWYDFKDDNHEVTIIRNRYEFRDDYTYAYNRCLLGADQIICATNAFRHELNTTVRKLQRRGFEPEKGDKVVCLTNHWNICSMQGNALTNGSIGEILSMMPYDEQYPPNITSNRVSLLLSQLQIEDDFFNMIPIDYECLTTGKMSVDDETLYRIKKYSERRARKGEEIYVPFDFSYGYAITCWKAQGSEWNNVLFFEERFPFDKDLHTKYLYTGITRASKKLILVAN